MTEFTIRVQPPRFAASAHASSTTFSGEPPQKSCRALGKRASKRKIALHIPHYVVVPIILARGDLIAVVPKSVATAYGYAAELKALPLPFDLPPVVVREFWHERCHHDPGHRWFRATLAELFRR